MCWFGPYTHQSATSLLSELLIFECNSSSRVFKIPGFQVVKNAIKTGFGFGKTWVGNTSCHAVKIIMANKKLFFYLSKCWWCLLSRRNINSINQTLRSEQLSNSITCRVMAFSQNTFCGIWILIQILFFEP